ncbi:MFS transporter [Candidatus Poriferisodalis sp.]|uniref:MFS transporter n=1 Tax=Candidatus Poriferisodalis sp. TaxID=3101277 RepID=UPI003D0D97DB
MQPFTWLARTHLLSAAGDALIAIALAGSLFFNLDPAAARPKVALYLIVTMAPFALVGPLIGPLVDRSRGGRRGMIIGAGVARAVLALLMVRHLNSLLLFPEAFGALVAGKTYHVAKSAVVPGLVREQSDLVEANSKLMLLSGLGGAIAAGPGLLLSLISSRWVLVLASVVFVLMTFPAARLPRQAIRPPRLPRREAERPGGHRHDFGRPAQGVEWQAETGQPWDPSYDSPLAEPYDPGYRDPHEPGYGDQPLADPHGRGVDPGAGRGRPPQHFGAESGAVEPEVRRGAMLLAGSAMGVVRAMTGFTLFLIAFWLRADDAAPWWFGFMFTASALGQLAGAVLAPPLRRRVREEALLVSVLSLAAAVSLFVATAGDRVSVLGLAMVIGFMSSMGKLCFDAIVQRDELPADHGRAFARFETRFQLMWVIGALVPVIAPNGILPLRAGVTLLGVAATAAVFLYAGGLWALARGRRTPSEVIATRMKTRVNTRRRRHRDG